MCEKKYMITSNACFRRKHKHEKLNKIKNIQKNIYVVKLKVIVVIFSFESKFFVFFIYSFKAVATTHEKKNINDDNDDIEENINLQFIFSKTNNSSEFKNFKNTLNIVVMKKKIIFKMIIIMKTMIIKLKFF